VNKVEYIAPPVKNPGYTIGRELESRWLPADDVTWS